MTEQEEFEFRHRLEQEQASAPRVAAPKMVAPNSMPDASPNYLEDTNWLQRGMIGAGKATNDLLLGVGFTPDGAIGKHIVTEPMPEADKQLMSDPAGLIGNIGGQAGLMYVGGKGLQGAGKLLGAARGIGALGQAAGRGIEAAGNAVISPASYKQAAAVGAGWGALSQPGDLIDRAENAGIGAIGGTGGLLLGRGIGKVATAIKSAFTPSSTVESQAAAKLAEKGVDFGSLPQAVRDQITKVANRSLESLDGLDADQLARMADFEKLGIKPTRGWVTRDPKDWWMENNLNTVDSQIASRFKDANQTLLQKVSEGVGDASDYERGRVLQGVVNQYDAGLKGKADTLYEAARNAAGRDIPLDPNRFVNNASVELDQQMLGSKLPGDTINWFQKVTGGSEPFDMGTALQRLQALNGRIYSTNDPAEAKALGIVKSHLIDAIDGGGAPANGVRQDLADAFKAARSAAADRFRFQESNPLVEQVIKGKYTPEKLPDLIGSMKVDDLKSLSTLEAERGIPVMDALRGAARSYVRDAATLQGETGGTFSQNGIRKALDKIGPEKGELLFGKDGWGEYQRVLRAAGSINNAPLKPVGSSTMPNLLRAVQRVPGLGRGFDTLIAAGSKVKQLSDVGRAMDAAGGLLMPVKPRPPSRLPLLTTPGLLGVSE
ncbi:hypothetical protein ACNFH8_28150 [Pseudomonas sp. NY15436]|uniref:hypothetical protein n=1 Tax=Pseudomonas sp. NY15436 TaxID=3400359 RepID=UPI003A8ABB72